ncbi:MAG: hypothetical protein V1800_13315 [Candidatus Latescibacterota bacterium]
MGTNMDLIGSFIIGGTLILTILTLNATLADSSYQNTLDLIVQQNMTALGRIIQDDFSKMGFGVFDPATVLLLADSTHITFQTDLDQDGQADTLRYYISEPAAATSTLNPDDRLLYRVVNSEPVQGDSWGVTEFALRYLDIGGLETGDLGSVRAVEVSLMLKGADPYGRITVEGVEKDRYSQAVWETTFWPRSLNP